MSSIFCLTCIHTHNIIPYISLCEENLCLQNFAKAKPSKKNYNLLIISEIIRLKLFND